MKKLCCTLLALCLVASCAIAAELNLFTTPAPECTLPPAPPLSDVPLMESPPISLNCGAALLMEAGTGQILFEMNADIPRPVASVTKIMTILLTLEAIEQGRINIDQCFTISENAAGMGGSQVLLDVGETQSVDILLKSMIVGSANDASVALAELMYGSEEICVDKMNQRAAQLGMQDTVFVNCTGLPAQGQHTTARDVARMTQAMLQHELYYRYSAIWMDEVDHGDGRKTQLTNTNKLIRLYDGCDGGKTGSTNEAGYCISATARRSDMRLIAVVLGADSGSERFDTAADMFDYGFANYRIYPVAQRGTKIRGSMPVNNGRPDSIRLQLNGDLTLLVNKGDEQNIRLEPELPQALNAPVEAGQTIGYVRVEKDGRTLAKIPVITSEGADPRGLSSGMRQFWRHWPLC